MALYYVQRILGWVARCTQWCKATLASIVYTLAALRGLRTFRAFLGLRAVLHGTCVELLRDGMCRSIRENVAEAYYWKLCSFAEHS
jgi:hypothetical protein